MVKHLAGLTIWSIMLIISITIWSGSVWAETTLLLGTGLPGGNYYKFGQLFAEAVNASTTQTGIRIELRPSNGSVSNINGLMEGRLQLALVQADTGYMACNKQGPWKNSECNKCLRTVYEIFTEAVTCVANTDAGIRSCADLRGKRVALGCNGSGSQLNAVQALNSCWLKPSDLSEAKYVNFTDAMQLMRQGKLDAFFYTVSHPNRALRNFISSHGRTCLVPFKAAKNMTKNAPYYVKYFIWRSYYPGLHNHGSKVDTFGIQSFMLTTDKVPADIIYEITRLYLGHLDSFKKRLLPMQEVELPGRQSHRDFTWAVSAPYHEGVKRLAKERGAM